MAAKYIIRIDDICPTLDWELWYRLEHILESNGVKPILAVIPDNQDKTLHVGRPNQKYWEDVRRWQAQGWTIGLHGHQHVYTSNSRGLLGVNRYSEFAGLPFDTQYQKLRTAVTIFERENVRPDLWIAPAHTFDTNTIKALTMLGIQTISDGFHFRPHVDRRGVFWIPQQLGDFHRMPFGLWTVCIHLQDPVHADSERFRRQIERFRPDIVDAASVIRKFSRYEPGLMDESFATVLGWLKRLRSL